VPRGRQRDTHGIAGVEIHAIGYTVGIGLIKPIGSTISAMVTRIARKQAILAHDRQIAPICKVWRLARAMPSFQYNLNRTGGRLPR